VEPRQKTISLWKRRKELPVLPLPGAAAAVFLLCLTASISGQCGIFALPLTVIGGVLLAGVLLLHRSVLSLCAPFLAGGIIILCASDVPAAVVSSLILPFGCAAAAAVYRGAGRMSASVACALCGGVFLFAVGAVYCLFSGITLSEAAEFLSGWLAEEFMELTVPVPGAGMLPLFSEEAVSALVKTLIPVLPMAFAWLLFLPGCAVTGLLRLLFVLLKADREYLPDPWYLRAGRAAALIYCAAQMLLLAALTVPDGRALVYSAYNTAGIFMLPLALHGCSALVLEFRFHRDIGILTKIAVAALGLMFLAAGIYWFFTAAAWYGIYIIFHRAKRGAR